MLLLLWAVPLHAQEISYDRYGSVWEEGEAPRSRPASKKLRTDFLTYPLEIVRWPIDQSLVMIEKYHLDDKAEWIYEQMKKRGFTPKVRSIAPGNLGGGFEIELVKLARLKDEFPNTTVEGSALWTVDEITEYQAKVLQTQIAGQIDLGGNFRYEDRGEEHFYGIGPDTSLGDGTSYRMERTTLEGVSGVHFLDTWEARGRMTFQNVNITDGEDEGRGVIDEIFVDRGQSIPGLAGDEMIRWAVELIHDDRDNQDLPSSGGYQRFHLSYNKGMENEAGFLKYRAEAGQFIQVFSPNRVFGVHALVEHNDETGDRRVPFFDMARLGGYGAFPRLGDPHRGYRRDRFYDESLLLFNAEYRWLMSEYRSWRVEPVIFCDMGQVFGEWSDFQIEDFSFSYGLGFRVTVEKKMLVGIEFAKSNEGFEFYVKTKTPF